MEKMVTTLLNRIKKLWQQISKAVGWFTTNLLLLIIYLFLGLIATMIKISRKDLLDRKIYEAESYWKIKEKKTHLLEQAKHQF